MYMCVCVLPRIDAKSSCRRNSSHREIVDTSATKNVVIFKGSFFALLFISKRKEFEVFEGTSSPTIPATPWQSLIRLMLVEFVTLWHAIVDSL